ncbi:MAG: hypothetical protein AVDCRST_MAG93-3952, partial [uncultured Chloroflexia bacterium]
EGTSLAAERRWRAAGQPRRAADSNGWPTYRWRRQRGRDERWGDRQRDVGRGHV